MYLFGRDKISPVPNYLIENFHDLQNIPVDSQRMGHRYQEGMDGNLCFLDYAPLLYTEWRYSIHGC